MLEVRHLARLNVPGYGEGEYLVLESFPHEKRLTLLSTSRGSIRFGYKLIVLEKEVEVKGEPQKLPADIRNWPFLAVSTYLYSEMLEMKTAGELIGRGDIGNLPDGQPTAYRQHQPKVHAYIKIVSRLFEVAGSPNKEKLCLTEALKQRREFNARRVLPMTGTGPSRSTKRRIRRKQVLRSDNSRYSLSNSVGYLTGQRHVLDLRGKKDKPRSLRPRFVSKPPKKKAKPLTAAVNPAEEVALSEEALMEGQVKPKYILKQKKKKEKIPF